MQNNTKPRLLLISPSYRSFYTKAKVKIGTPDFPPLNLALLAAYASKYADVKILDMLVSKNPEKDLNDTLTEFAPNIVGIGFTTPQFGFAKEIADQVKTFNKDIQIIGGGVHATALPEEVLTKTAVDVVALGEADWTIQELLSKYPKVDGIDGIAVKNGNNIFVGNPRGPVTDMNSLPLPRWDLIENKKEYKRQYAKRTPLGLIMTSRGCPGGCVYCNKNIYGRFFRAMSPERTVNEIEHNLNSGFNEINVADDTFTFDIIRAKKICDLIKERKLDFPWTLFNGIRVDRVDKEFLEKARDAGCYHLAFGVESGNQQVLNAINKGITLEQVRAAFKLSKEVGITTVGYFMLGLPTDTKETMQQTIDLAVELDPDYVKFTIATPMPGTAYFNYLEQRGCITSKNWEDFHFHAIAWKHPNLSWETIHEYYDKAYKSFYYRPKYIQKRLFSPNVFTDAFNFMKNRFSL